ncbi:hypothetical protein IWW54_004686 [Coemansia sp. RSA 2705]|nr:hypothetical protein IWW54_004686 [Coemansia sp. RSA 2705]
MSLLTRSLFLARSGTLVLQRGLKRNSKIPVTLLEAVPKVGPAGAVVQVNKAFMRHELYPKRLADYVPKYTGPLDRSRLTEQEQESAAETAKGQIDLQHRVHSLALRNQEIIAKLVDIDTLVFERNVMASDADAKDATQTLYGSLTKADVAKALAELHGIVVDRDALNMEDKIKSTGYHTCSVKLIYAGQASFTIQVVPTTTATTVEAKEEA